MTTLIDIHGITDFITKGRARQFQSVIFQINWGFLAQCVVCSNLLIHCEPIKEEMQSRQKFQFLHLEYCKKNITGSTLLICLFSECRCLIMLGFNTLFAPARTAPTLLTKLEAEGKLGTLLEFRELRPFKWQGKELKLIFDTLFHGRTSTECLNVQSHVKLLSESKPDEHKNFKSYCTLSNAV